MGWGGGGSVAGRGSTVKAEALLPHSILVGEAAVAALLNACPTSGVSYPLGTAQIISEVNTALTSCDRTMTLNEATKLDNLNNGPGGCPLGGRTTKGLSFRN